MATTTPKLGLPRPEDHDNVTRENHIELIDAIDENAASQSELDAVKGTAESHAGRHASGGADEITPAMIGAETPSGAQAKANNAETNAKQHADGNVADLAGAGRTTETVKGNADALTAHLDEKATDPIRPHGMGTIAKEDYEEGEFTPTLQFGGGSAGMSYSSRSDRFTKVGRKIHVQGTINLSAKGSSTGNASITGLPFSSASSGPIVSAPLYALRVNPDVDTVGGVWATLNAGVSEVLIAIARSAGGLSLNDTHFVDNSVLRFEFTYTI